ncbi:predicted protein [Thalassiosira pseudonana CCMP1335]|uniref:Thioredoxin domain-containing protein n=1 Tax=Thalassiosira pseudonana TaxID=35128 RepID=B8CCS4_THAPS|nr:predicted protein [Thalassiosira pseudonana CCMP1335]EED89001.1 predicted protein [Thalassiosira pseudonana CCMP1335]
MKLAAFLLAVASSTSALELTPDNFAAETDGKTVFLKFFAPWCGHCKALKPDWDKLMEEFAGSSTQLIADIDCTAGGEPLCGEHGIQGFPTLKWGDPADLQDYEGGRSYDDLKAFADANLKPLCSVKNIDLCEPEKKTLIESYLKMDKDELQSLVEKEEEKIANAESNFESELEKLQAAYEKLSTEKDQTIADVKNAGLGMMKSVLKSKDASDGKDEL